MQTTGTSKTNVMSQKAVSENTCLGYLASSTGDFNVTLGRDANSTGTANITIGLSSTSNNKDHQDGYSDDCIPIGTSASVTKFGGTSIGSYAKCTGEQSVALGYGSEATSANVVSVSGNNVADKRRIINVGDPINSQDAATKYYVDSKVAESSGESNVTVVQATGESETDVMSQKATTDAIPTKTSELENDSKYVSNNATDGLGTAIGERSVATGASGVAFGYLSTASGNFRLQ